MTIYYIVILLLNVTLPVAYGSLAVALILNDAARLDVGVTDSDNDRDGVIVTLDVILSVSPALALGVADSVASQSSDVPSLQYELVHGGSIGGSSSVLVAIATQTVSLYGYEEI